MTKKVLLIFGFCIVFLFSSCMTYTYEDAKAIIPEEPQVTADELVSTRESIPEPTKKQAIRPIEVALIPLPCNAEESQLDVIIQQVDTKGYDIVGFTGETQSLVYVASLLRTPVYWTQQGQVIATKLPVKQASGEFPLVTLENGQGFRVSLVDTQQSTVFQALQAESDRTRWESIVTNAHPSREKSIQPMVAYEGEEPLLVLASLGEPAATDWFETAEDHPYRTEVNWPIIEKFLAHRFLDSWKMTHYDATSAPGITWKLVTDTITYAERVDFLLSKGLLPMRTTTIMLTEEQKERLPYEQRFALTGTFIIP